MARSSRPSERAAIVPPAEPKPHPPRKLLRRVVDATADVHHAGDVLTTLQAVRALREAVDELEQTAVVEARQAGMTWTQIGSVYRLSKQGAQQRFRSS